MGEVSENVNLQALGGNPVENFSLCGRTSIQSVLLVFSTRGPQNAYPQNGPAACCYRSRIRRYGAGSTARLSIKRDRSSARLRSYFSQAGQTCPDCPDVVGIDPAQRLLSEGDHPDVPPDVCLRHQAELSDHWSTIVVGRKPVRHPG